MATPDNVNCALARIASWDLSEKFELAQIAGKKVELHTLLTDGQKDTLRREFGVDLDAEDDPSHYWKLVSTYDTNSEDGFYACMIETSPDHVTMSFRGTELDNMQWLEDLQRADLGLFNRMATEQQERCDRMLRKRAYRDILMRYGHINMVGHSLGGNLAEYAAIACADDDDLSGKIDEVVSLDGPGFSKKFINEHREQIARIASKTRHYRWSFIGALEHDLPGVAYQYVKVDKDECERAIDEGDEKCPYWLAQHFLNYIKLENGSFVEDAGGAEWYENAVGFTSTVLDATAHAGETVVTKAPWAVGFVPFVGPALAVPVALYGVTTVLTYVSKGASWLSKATGDKKEATASDEADEYPEIYLDIDRFKELAQDCAGLIERLKNASTELGSLVEVPVESVTVPRNIWGHELLQAAFDAVATVENAFDDLFKKTAKSKECVDKSIKTLEGVKTYLHDTAADFAEVETLAGELVENWQATLYGIVQLQLEERGR